jgi:parallel beta-helix repeat protein
MQNRDRRRLRRVGYAVLLGLVSYAVVGSGVLAASTTIFVDQANPNCSNSGTGSVTQPFCTISAASAKVVPGVTVQVAAGNYPEKVTVQSGTAAAPVLYTAAPGATVTVGKGQADGFVASGKSYVTINGFTVTSTTSYGIDVSSGSSNVTVSNNDVSYSGTAASGLTKYGIRVTGSGDCVVKGNAVHHNSDTGIAVVGSSSRIQVLGNNTYNNARGYQRAAAGIRVVGSSDNTISGNITHDNEDSGVESYPGATNTLITNNVSYDNGDHGFDNLTTTNQRIIGNTAYHNVTAGINVEGSSTGAVVENNISVDNGIKSPRTHSDIRIEHGSTTGAVVDYNVTWLTTPDTLYIWDSVSYSTLAAFQAASGQGAHEIWKDPKWRNLAARDFHLAAGSPAIDSADSGVAGQPASDVEGTARIDDPATPNTGAGPRAYDDRGAYEFNGVPLDHIVISPATASIAAGGFQTYTVQAFDTKGNSFDATSSSTFTIAPDGSCAANVCTATKSGPHTVTANDQGFTSTASLTVTPGPLDHLALSPSSATIAAGAAQTYTADGRDQYNNSLGDVTSTTTFSISPDGTCTGASCTATTTGAHTVTGTKSGKTGTASLTVTAGALDHLILSPASATLIAGQSQTYTAEGRDQYDNSLGDVTASTTFSIAPDGSCTGASCTATAAGAHTVTGTKNGKTGTASLQVNPAVDHIVISPKSATVSAGSAQAFTAEGFDAANNSLGDVTAFTTFSISPDGVCTGGSCTATTAGPHTVTANDAGKTDSATLTVTAGPLDHLALSPGSATITAGGSQAYTADGRDQYDNSLGDVTASTTFSIGPNGSCTGATCTASTAGTHTVTGTKSGKTGTASLQVNPVTVDHIVVSPSSAAISAGGSQTFTAEGFDAANNSLGDVTSSTTFTIGPNGSCTGNTCTATAAGPHTVTGTDAAKTSTSTLTVNAGPLDHLALSPASSTIAPGGSQAYTAQGRDQYNNSLGDVTGSTTFSIAPDGSCTGASCSATTAGAHTVTGTSGGKTGTASLQVGAAPLDHIVVSPSTATISAGGSQTYTAEGFDASNNSLGDVTAFTTFSISPEGVCTGASCTANAGGPHTVTGNDGGKTSTASLSVSYVKNPGFETGLTGWNTSGSDAGVTLAQTTTTSHSGAASASLTNTSAVAATCLLNDSPNWALTTSAATYTGTVWARADTAGATLNLRFREYAGSTLAGSALTQVQLTTTWQQVSVTFAAAAGDTLDFNAYVTKAAPGPCFYADDAAITSG